MKIDTGDEELDLALELEQELKNQVQDLMDENGFEATLSFIVSHLSAGAAWEARWRFRDGADLEDDNHPAPTDTQANTVVPESCEELYQLITEISEELDREEIIELLLESADIESSRRVLGVLDN